MKKDDNFYYVNDENTKVDSEPLFTDHSANYEDGLCAVILPDANIPSKFHLQAVGCDAKAKAFCRANATVPPPPGENLPSMPCVQISKRKRRQTNENECQSTEANENACTLSVKGICNIGK